MADFTPDITKEVVSSCADGSEEAAESFTRTFEQEVTFSTVSAKTLNLEELPENWSGPGLALMLKVGESGAVVLLPEDSGLIAKWYAEPDPTEKSKLTTLAQELGMILLPDEFMPEDFQAGRVPVISDALKRTSVSDGAGLVPITITGGEKTGELSLIWPVPNPEGMLEPAVEESDSIESTAEVSEEASPAEELISESHAPQKKAAHPTPKPAPRFSIPLPDNFEEGIPLLPDYIRSLLKIKVPITVTLAIKRQPLNSILDLAPGSIIQFEKSCEEMLQLEVSNQPVGLGEAVKVGDKFGLRLTSVILPSERFEAVKGSRSRTD